MRKKYQIFSGLMMIAMLGCFHSSLAEEDTITSEDVAALRIAAANGDADAQFELGEAYEKGEGVYQDDTQAARWYQLAANQGDPDGQFAIGFAYRGGFGVPQDKIVAYMWFDLAAAQGSVAASSLRSAIAELMTYDEIADARKRARKWKPELPEKAEDEP